MNKKIILILMSILLLTGCTKYKTYDKQSVVIESTGQRVVENVLCKTETTEEEYNKLKEQYKITLDEQLNNASITQEDYDKKLEELNNSFDLSDVAYCTEFQVFAENEGLWTTLFVKTLAWLLLYLLKH